MNPQYKCHLLNSNESYDTVQFPLLKEDIQQQLFLHVRNKLITLQDANTIL